jgi:hypothetical protein
MISILAVSLVGSWTYAGFLADPSPAPSPAAETNIPPASAPADSGIGGPIGKKPSKDSAVPARATPGWPGSPQASPPPKPTLHRSTDALGQTWEHPDPAYLASFVQARNRSFATYTYAPTPPARASRCYQGRCN